MTASLPLNKVADVPLPGGTSRFDYQSLDQGRNLLFIAHLGAGQIVTFDTGQRTVVRNIGHIEGVHGVLVVPELNKVFASATDKDQLITLDEGSGDVLSRTPTGRYPDGIAYDSPDRRVFVSDESAGSETVADATSGKLIGTVRLGGKAGNVQYDSGSRHILVSVQSRNEIAFINPRNLRITRRKQLSGCKNNHGLYLDAERRLAFIACDGNDRLLVLDLKSMKITSNHAVGGGPDVLAFDQGLRRLYVAAEDGVISVFAENGRKLIKISQGYAAKSAHSVAVDSRTHLVYLPLERVGDSPALRIMAPTGRTSRG